MRTVSIAEQSRRAVAASRKTRRIEREQGAAFVRRWKAGLREEALAARPHTFRTCANPAVEHFAGHRTCAEW